MLFQQITILIIITKSIIFILLFCSEFLLERNKISLKDKISVIIPTYNRGKSIIQSINSVLEQTYHNLEILIVDDCSTDDTEYLISKIDDPRVKFIKLKENKGASFARNIGIKIATGKYISFQDSDDIYKTNKIEKQYIELYNLHIINDICFNNF